MVIIIAEKHFFLNIQIDSFNQEAVDIYFQSSHGNLTVTDGIQPA